MKNYLVFLFVVLTASIMPFVAWAHFSDFTHPQYPGERSASAVVELRGLDIKKMDITLVYSDNATAVRNAFDMRARNPNQYAVLKATVQNLGNGKARCTVVFPLLVGLRPPIKTQVVHFACAAEESCEELFLLVVRVDSVFVRPCHSGFELLT